MISAPRAMIHDPLRRPSPGFGALADVAATALGRATGVDTDIGADCTRCGLCVDICPTDSLRFKFKGLDKVL